MPNVARDGKWHRAQFNLQRSLVAQLPFAPGMYSLSRLVSQEAGYSGEGLSRAARNGARSRLSEPACSGFIELIRLVVFSLAQSRVRQTTP